MCDHWPASVVSLAGYDIEMAEAIYWTNRFVKNDCALADSTFYYAFVNAAFLLAAWNNVQSTIFIYDSKDDEEETVGRREGGRAPRRYEERAWLIREVYSTHTYVSESPNWAEESQQDGLPLKINAKITFAVGTEATPHAAATMNSCSENEAAAPWE